MPFRIPPVSPPTSRRGRLRAAVIAIALLFSLSAPGAAFATGLDSLVIGENTRMVFERDLVRIAVGDPGIAAVQMITNREILVLGRRAGQTNVLLWFVDGRVVEHTVSVQRDLALLSDALRAIHPAIRASSAPDQNAVVLRGIVPEARYSRAAEKMTRDYLRGGSTTAGGRSGSLILGAGGEEAGAATADAAEESGAAEETAALDFLLEDARDRRGGRVINLIRVDDVPPPLEERLARAVADSSVEGISVRRLTAGVLPDDGRDTFVLEGQVRTQVDLVRALLAAARTIDDRVRAEQIRVVADESGSLAGQSQGNAGGGGGGGGATIAGVGGTIGGGGLGRNNLRANVARAKALSLANGRILSFIEVTELPHVRLETRIYEVNRSRLSTWAPSAVIALENTDRFETTATPSDVQGVISLLQGGAIFAGAQYVNDRVAIDLALDLAENASVARALARPTLSVLSGEIAQFSAGGQIPINVTVDTTTSATSGTLLSSTVFADFGINVSVRPLVGEDDTITLDVTPTISQPDFDLTAQLVDATESQQTTTAFQSRSLRTTTRLRDGQSFVIGGLLQTTLGRGSDFTPWFHRVPGLGWLGKTRDDQRDELDFVVVVTPSLNYEPDYRTAMWAYPDANEILAELMP
ncbi:MAG: pilus assembly protein N-terminal domain-containing protein [Myxococcota bacterium]